MCTVKMLSCLPYQELTFLLNLKCEDIFTFLLRTSNTANHLVSFIGTLWAIPFLNRHFPFQIEDIGLPEFFIEGNVMQYNNIDIRLAYLDLHLCFKQLCQLGQVISFLFLQNSDDISKYGIVLGMKELMCIKYQYNEYSPSSFSAPCCYIPQCNSCSFQEQVKYNAVTWTSEIIF